MRILLHLNNGDYCRELLGLAWMKPDKHVKASHVIQASQRFNEVSVVQQPLLILQIIVIIIVISGNYCNCDKCEIASLLQKAAKPSFIRLHY